MDGDMTDEREKLIHIIRQCVTDGAGNIRVWSERSIADAILAAGFGDVAKAQETDFHEQRQLAEMAEAPKEKLWEPAQGARDDG